MYEMITVAADGALCILGGAVVAALIVKCLDMALNLLIRVGGGL